MDRQAADKAARKIYGRHLLRGTPSNSPATVSEAATMWVLENPHDAYPTGLFDEYVDEMLIDEIPADLLVKFVASMSGAGLSASTIRKGYYAARNICRMCHKKWDALMPEESALPKEVNSPRDIPAEDLAYLFDHIKERGRRILEFLLETGARPSEGRLLKWDQIDWKRQTAAFGRDEQHKTKHKGKARTLYLTPRAIEILESTPKESEYVFLSRNGRPYKTNSLRSFFRRNIAATTYRLRHTFAQNALDGEAPVDVVAKFLGHSDLRTVQVYAQTRDDRARTYAQTLVSPLQRQRDAKPSSVKPSGHAARVRPKVSRRTRGKSKSSRTA
jgi:integrase